jgi:hypothetical protein
VTRNLYGLDLAAYGIDGATGAPVPFATYKVWPAQSGGSQTTDLLDLSSNPVSLVTADSHGYIGFYGPDGWVDDLWLEGASAVRLLVRPSALTARVIDLEGTAFETGGITQSAADSRYAQFSDLDSRVAKGSLIVNVQDYGAVGDGTTNDTAAISAAISALRAGDGGTLLFPATGQPYMTDGAHPWYAYCHLAGSEHTSRYYGYNPTTPPPAACAIQMRPGSTAQAMFITDGAFTAGSMRDITLLGANVGTAIHGIQVTNPDAGVLNNMTLSNAAIIGFTGDGMRGRLFASRFHHLFVGGCHGWGLNCPGSTQWTDLWFHQCILTENIKGGLNIDSTGSSGEIHFVGCRFERSGWDSAHPTTPVATSSPGIKLAGNLLNASFIGCSTDANSGHGVDINVPTGRSLHHIRFVGCAINRDGFGTMAGSSPGDFAAIRVKGTSSNFLERLSFVDCTTTEGKADDGGGEPDYVHPKYGLWSEYTTFLGVHGGSISAGHATPLYGGTGGLASNYRPLINTRVGDNSVTVIAGGDTSERGPAFQAGLFVNFEAGVLQVCFDGATWTDVGPPP